MARHKVLRSPRLARRARRRAGRRIVFAASALALLLTALLFLITREPFSIREVVVSGASDDLRVSITELARAELAGAYFSLVPKENAFAYPKREIEEKILERFPRVQSARAHLFSPSRLQIAVREREGVALWCVPLHGRAHRAVARAPSDREECVRIDAGGVAFENAPVGGNAQYRISAGVGGNISLSPLGTRVLSESRLTALLSFLRSLEEFSLSPSRLTLLQGGDVSAEIAGGGKILAREGADFLKQADNLQGLLSEKDLVPRNGEKLRIDYIDLRHGNKLYFKPR